MSYVERGLYRELLDECWAEGSIPSDLSELAEICDCPEQVLADAWPKLGKCFVEAGLGRLRNLRLEAERTETDKIRAAKALAGKAGGTSKSRKIKAIPVNGKQLLAARDGCHIGEGEKNKVLPPKPPTGGSRRRTRVEILAAFGENTRAVVNALAPIWRDEDPKDSRKITISPQTFGENVDGILESHPEVSGGILIQAAKDYLAEPRERYKAPQYFFGPEGPWKGYVRTILTRLERERETGTIQPLQLRQA